MNEETEQPQEEENPVSPESQDNQDKEETAETSHENNPPVPPINPAILKLRADAEALDDLVSEPLKLAEGKSSEEISINPLHVKLAAYDGPLELLLDLIKRNEMDIYNIQISEITKQYLEHLSRMRELDLEVAGEFIVMAATLIYIKSKMLLPTDDEGEEDEMGDPRAELVQKLLEYQAFKEAAKELGFLETERGKIFTRQISEYYLADLDPEDAGIDTFSANLYDLLSAFQSVLVKFGKKGPHEVYEEIISIEEKITEIQALLIEMRKVTFTQLFGKSWTRNELIATFLAILEIVRTKFARVQQEKQFGEIFIEKMEEVHG